MSEETKELPISRDLLDILRDPLAVQEPEKYGDDPGQLELIGDHWLVSKDTGLKYPIRDGIPVMLIDEGEKWKETAVADLPVPPPADQPAATSENEPSAASAPANEKSEPNIPIIGVAIAGVLGLAIIVGKLFSRKKEE